MVGSTLSDSVRRVIHVVPSLDRKFGGPGWSVTSLCGALAQEGLDVTLASLDLTGEGKSEAVQADPSVPTVLFQGWHLERFGAVIAPGFRSNLRQLIVKSKIDVIHDHGLWLQTNRDASLVARNLGIPLVAAPRGTLGPWPLRQKKWKKRTAWCLYQRRALGRATVLHATSRLEAQSFRQLGLEHPIAILPNAVDGNEFALDGAARRREALFLSRFHTTKGLLNLVRAWSEVRPEGWSVRLVGPDEAGHRSELEAAVRELNLEDRFEFSGPVYGKAKARQLAQSDLFILPTKSENFGIVVAEALAAGTPVITTRAAPWKDLEDHDCGWWIDVGVQPLARALADATRRDLDELEEMGRRGRQLVREKYSWDRVAHRTLKVYRWLMEGASRPDCVVPERAEV